MINKFICLLVLIAIFSSSAIHAQDRTLYTEGRYASKNDTLPYRVLFPVQFNPKQKYPVVFVLHGRGECGNDNKKQLTHGADLFLNTEVRQNYQAIVIFPQCPTDSFWSNVKIETDSVTGNRKFLFQTDGEPTKAMKALLGLTNEWMKKPYVNKKQVYVGGLSMGGMGTFELIGRKPKMFAAAFPICGGDNTLNAKKYAKKVPLWIFHGAKDNVVPADHSIVMVEALKEAGGEPKFSLYPDAMHDSWLNAFAEPELLPWLFSHKK
ncbi:phospholipase [Mucilaginibacter hurinus]|uniref:Phospholipase n=1 Tax=Mucilaginibacter hurinus TaxID=2201324 RepID=A0A367GRS3_9SPHI|nr:prolyl oligopeptidase family serine peptidase [Mucilaginibacter hurinus]RCH55526.1 phospholipase [Mucilaginibacter hurinus]